MMNAWEIWLLAFSLAMDCFSVSVASGALLKKIVVRTIIRTAFFFGLFQAAMPLLGWFAASLFSDKIQACDHWIAFGLLGLLGVKMIVEGIKPENDGCHFDISRLAVVLTLAVATSIDALAVGITFAFTGYADFGSLLFPVGIIGVVSFAMSVAGSLFGALARRLLNFKMEIIGGLVLIGLGTKILIEHLCAS